MKKALKGRNWNPIANQENGRNELKRKQNELVIGVLALKTMGSSLGFILDAVGFLRSGHEDLMSRTVSKREILLSKGRAAVADR